jgi:DNA primase
MAIAPKLSIQDRLTEHPPERRGVSRSRVIEAAKEAVPVIDLADLIVGAGGLKRLGAEWVGRCPLPDHEDRTPSFTVSPEKNLWFCHGCVRGGDVVELARFAFGFEKIEAPMAAAFVLEKFGHELPARPDSWFGKNARQAPVRDVAEECRKRAFRRRSFRALVAEYVARGIEDEDELRSEMAAAWRDWQDCLGRIGR